MTTSFRLEAPRPRPPPLPLRTSNLIGTRSPPPRIIGTQDSPTTLLYDLPPTAPSPTRANSSLGYVSPTSPTGRSRSRASRGGMRMTPPPSGGRAPTPSRVGNSDLEEFAVLCRAWCVLPALSDLRFLVVV